MFKRRYYVLYTELIKVSIRTFRLYACEFNLLVGSSYVNGLIEISIISKVTFNCIFIDIFLEASRGEVVQGCDCKWGTECFNTGSFCLPFYKLNKEYKIWGILVT